MKNVSMTRDNISIGQRLMLIAIKIDESIPKKVLTAPPLFDSPLNPLS